MFYNRRMTYDAQQALGFLVSQVTHLEPQVLRVIYVDIQYPTLVPIDTSAQEWAKSVTYFSMDKVGQATWFNGMATDMPVADVQHTKFEQPIEMAGIGYRYTLEELGQAMMIPGLNLTSERAEAARRAYEEFMEIVMLRGDTARNWTGLFNDATATASNTAGSWAAATPDNIIKDINTILGAQWQTTLGIEMSDTLLLPLQEFNRLASTPRATGSDMSILEWVKQYNVYTSQTGQPLLVRGVIGLETAGAGATQRAIAYRRDMQVLKGHVPMPHRFLPVWQSGPVTYDIPGIFRTGGTEVRRPKGVRYLDQL